MTILNNCCNILKLNGIFYRQATAVRNISTARYGLCAGHSKWANIRHIKAAKDGQKSTLFTKLSRQIRVAIQEGGGTNVSLNSQLKSVIDEALRKNMPMATIQNNIKKIQQNKTDIKRYTVDLRYKQKVFAVCVVYTENYAGLKMEMATILRKAGAIFSDSHNLFDEVGVVQALIDKSRLESGCNLEDLATEDAITFGAEDIEIIDKNNGVVNFFCRPYEIMALRKVAEANGYLIEESEHLYIPHNVVELLPEESAAYQKFVAKLKDLNGVEEIYDNINVV